MKLLKQQIAVLGLILAGVAPAADTPANLQLIMVSKVNPYGLALWDVTNNAMDDNGNVLAKKLTPESWKKLQEIGSMLEQGGKELTAAKVIAAAPGSKLQDEGNPDASTAKDVQRYIDAKPAEFRKHAAALQKTGAEVLAAVKAHDVKKLGAVSNSLDAVCEQCHIAFWYPQLAK